MKKIKFIILAILVIIAGSCIKEFERPQWDVDLKAPLFHGSLDINNLIADSISGNDENGLINLVYENEIFKFGLDSFLSMPDTGSYYAAYLDSIKIAPVTVVEQYTLGEIIADAGLTIFIPDGSVITIPPLAGLASNDLPIDVSDVFQTMTLAHGFLDIVIQNNLPIDISNMIFQLSNTNSGTIVLLDTFAYIPSGASFTETVSLEGNTVEGNLTANILNMDSPGSAGDVTINYADAIVSTFHVYELQPSEATAIFPTQNIINSGDKIYFDLGEVELTEMIAKEGYLTLTAINTLPQEVHFTYQMPGLTMNNDTFKVSGSIAAAVDGNTTFVQTVHSMAGYHLDLRGAGPIETLHNEDMNANGIIDNDTINTIFVLSLVSIDSTGNLLSLSLQDSFIFESALTGLVPEYGQGYLGRDTFPASGYIDLDMFKDFTPGSIELEDVKLSLNVSNQLGVEAGFKLVNITAVNNETGNSETLVITGIENPFFFSMPSDPLSLNTPVDPVLVSYNLNNSNSNASDLINVFPDRFNYSVELYLNPGNPPPFPVPGNDFIYNNSELNASVNIEVPLSLKASDLILTDTLDFNVADETVNKINSGKIFLEVGNMFPLSAEIELSLYDSITGISHILAIPSNTVLPGVVEMESGKVISPVISNLFVELTADECDMLSETTGLIARIRLNSPQGNEFVKIYSTYTFDIVLSADVNYHLN